MSNPQPVPPIRHQSRQRPQETFHHSHQLEMHQYNQPHGAHSGQHTIEMTNPREEIFRQEPTNQVTDSGVENVKGGKKSKEELDSIFDFKFKSVFKQHETTKLHPHLNWCIKRTYKYYRLALYHAVVVALAFPWVLCVGCINACLMCIYSWMLTPCSKIVTFLIHIIMEFIHSALGAGVKPLARIIHRILMTYCCKKKAEVKDVESTKKATIDLTAKIENV